MIMNFLRWCKTFDFLKKLQKLNSLFQTHVHAKKELLYMYSISKLSIQNNSFTTEYNIRISFIHVSVQPAEIMSRWIIKGHARSWSRLHNEDQNAWRYNMLTTNIVIHKKEQKSGKISKTKIKEVRLVYSSQEETLTPSKKNLKIPNDIYPILLTMAAHFSDLEMQRVKENREKGWSLTRNSPLKAPDIYMQVDVPLLTLSSILFLIKTVRLCFITNLLKKELAENFTV